MQAIFKIFVFILKALGNYMGNIFKVALLKYNLKYNKLQICKVKTDKFQHMYTSPKPSAQSRQ